MPEKNPKKNDNNKNMDPNRLTIPATLPVLPLHGFVFFPGMGFPLQVKDDSSKQLIDDTLLKDRLFAIVTHREGLEPSSHITPEELYNVGVAGYIHKLIKNEDGSYQILVSGIKKISITDFSQTTPYMVAKVAEIPMTYKTDQEIEALTLNISDQFKQLVEISKLPPELIMTMDSLVDPFHIAYLTTSQLHLPAEGEQHILEINDAKALLHQVTKEMAKRLETIEMSAAIQKNVKQDIDSKQREFFLRQQLAAIKKELGEDSDNLDLVELKDRLAKAKLPKEVAKVAKKELDRLSRISPSSSEYTVSRTYLDWILDLPWKKSTRDSLDIVKAEEHLNKDHYGLERIKKRIIEFLAVRKLKSDMHGPILCFAGPPGVGKTSLGQSIARSMGRKFIRLSLGGIRDEAEIRGHRRTYVGALPGRIIQSLKKAGSNNPLFMLDEIDKLGNDFRGDPSSALLEVLDPEQNSTFSDHYLEVNFDLSKVMFITTANYLENIPGPLRDRMEVITLTGYTEEEKLHIAKNHLFARQLTAHGLTSKNLAISDDAIRGVIRSYTREAGVRTMERKLAAICRGVAKNIVTGHKDKVTVGPDQLVDYLGQIEFFPETSTYSWGPGLATGLAWTPVGGVLLFVEAAMMKGTGAMTMTGKLGDVMKESTSAALTYIRAHAEELKVDEEIFSKKDLHIHVPEGATPKDGPSAGVAMVVALTSLFTDRSVCKDVAMTGEITLRGDVLPVGGVKEKVLAAVRSGITEIILPYLNQKDVAEIRENVKEGVTFHYVKKIEEALRIAIKDRGK
ncbi:MAG: endopeptidase La [Proteobacteria bacterium]|nr:endopeptidase La [Pseudomonadota bacterium]MBU1639634.1 endopeptidase La [Pseudomonadota bacterium]